MIMKQTVMDHLPQIHNYPETGRGCTSREIDFKDAILVHIHLHHVNAYVQRIRLVIQ